jgi:hypothetical protein
VRSECNNVTHPKPKKLDEQTWRKPRNRKCSGIRGISEMQKMRICHFDRKGEIFLDSLVLPEDTGSARGKDAKAFRNVRVFALICGSEERTAQICEKVYP